MCLLLICILPRRTILVSLTDPTPRLRNTRTVLTRGTRRIFKVYLLRARCRVRLWRCRTARSLCTVLVRLIAILSLRIPRLTTVVTRRLLTLARLRLLVRLYRVLLVRHRVLLSTRSLKRLRITRLLCKVIRTWRVLRYGRRRLVRRCLTWTTWRCPLLSTPTRMRCLRLWLVRVPTCLRWCLLFTRLCARRTFVLLTVW